MAAAVNIAGVWAHFPSAAVRGEGREDGLGFGEPRATCQMLPAPLAHLVLTAVSGITPFHLSEKTGQRGKVTCPVADS